jgi:hypothetical protein
MKLVEEELQRGGNNSDKKFYGSANMFASGETYPEQVKGQMRAAKSNHDIEQSME